MDRQLATACKTAAAVVACSQDHSLAGVTSASDAMNLSRARLVRAGKRVNHADEQSNDAGIDNVLELRVGSDVDDTFRLAPRNSWMVSLKTERPRGERQCATTHAQWMCTHVVG